jgi:hypothetical protein
MTMVLERPVAAPTVADPDTLVVVVRQEHIDRGVASNAFNCAIALAAQEGTGARLVIMALSILQVDHVDWVGGEDVIDFTFAFDTNRPVQPARFVFTRAPQ